jgi:putative PIN family toxin of toxin-antitoxin system
MSRPLRVVLDTNVVLSALVFRQGRMQWLRDHWQSGLCTPLCSVFTVQELNRVLAYEKFKLSRGFQLEALALYLPYCETVARTQPAPLVCRDPQDQPFLDLAHSGRADVLITGDADLLALTGQAGFAIETPAAYQQRLPL